MESDSSDPSFIAAVLMMVAVMGVSVYFLIQRNRYKRSVERLQEEAIKKEEQFNRLHKNYKHRLAQNRETIVAELKAKFEADNCHLISQAFVGESSKQLIATIRSSLEAKFNRTSQEFVGGLTDEAEGIARDINIELCERIWDCLQNYKEISKDTPLVMPDNCKIAYTKGRRTILVIEQKPQIRTVSFDPKLVKFNDVASEANSTCQTGYRFSLAFPYVYFFIVFDNGKYAFHELYFRNKMMASVREHVHLAPIPNVHRANNTNNPMCMGDGFAGAVHSEPSIAKQADLVISDFWQRTFSNDLGDGDHEKLDNRISNYAIWQQNTESDPLFVLSVSWPKGKTIKGVVEKLLDSRARTDKMDALDQEIRFKLESGVARLTQRIKEEIKNAKAKGLSPFDLDQMSKDIFEKAILDHSKLVFLECVK